MTSHEPRPPDAHCGRDDTGHTNKRACLSRLHFDWAATSMCPYTCNDRLIPQVDKVVKNRILALVPHQHPSKFRHSDLDLLTSTSQ